MALKILSLIILMTSCASVQEKRIHAWEAWKNRPVADIEKHPYFRSLPLKKIQHEDGPDTWVYHEQSKFQTRAYCDSLGGCMGLPTYNCDNIFSIENDVILGFEQKGSCPQANLIDPDRK